MQTTRVKKKQIGTTTRMARVIWIYGGIYIFMTYRKGCKTLRTILIRLNRTGVTMCAFELTLACQNMCDDWLCKEQFKEMSGCVNFLGDKHMASYLNPLRIFLYFTVWQLPFCCPIFKAILLTNTVYFVSRLSTWCYAKTFGPMLFYS